MNNEELMSAVAARNPVDSEELTSQEKVRAQALLERTVILPQQGTSTSGLRRSSRFVRVAGTVGVLTLGLGGVAWAADITPGTVAAAVHIVRAADAGTVEYAVSAAAEAQDILEAIAAAALAGPDAGELGETVLVTSTSCNDMWDSESTSPTARCVSRSDWTMLGGNHRIEETVLAGGGAEETGDLRLEEFATVTPSGPARIGSQMTLGPTVRDTESQLGGPGGHPWKYVETYVGHYFEGVGLTSTNRAAFVELLSSLQPTYLGAATDAMGRTGEAFSVTRSFTGYSEEYRLVIDPNTGALLAFESVLHGPWFVLGSRDHVTDSITFGSVEAVADLEPCETTPGCQFIPAG